MSTHTHKRPRKRRAQRTRNRTPLSLAVIAILAVVGLSVPATAFADDVLLQLDTTSSPAAADEGTVGADDSAVPDDGDPTPGGDSAGSAPDASAPAGVEAEAPVEATAQTPAESTADVPAAVSAETPVAPTTATRGDDSTSSNKGDDKGSGKGDDKGHGKDDDKGGHHGGPKPSEPSWELAKTSEPASGSSVSPGQNVTYTLTAENTSDVTISDALATDDVSNVIPAHATLVEPLADDLSLDGSQLIWSVPTLEPGADPVSVSYVVTVNADAFGQEFDNVATPGENGECVSSGGKGPKDHGKDSDKGTGKDSSKGTADSGKDSGTDSDKGSGGTGHGGKPPHDKTTCTTHHRVIDIDLALLKTASTPDGNAVESGVNDLVTHTLDISNVGDDPSWRTSITDTLPAGLTADPTSVAFTPADPDGHWTVTVSDGLFIAQHDGWFQPGDVQSVSFVGTVGELERGADTDPFADLVNAACVASEQRPGSTVEGPGFDSDLTNNCDTARTPVASMNATALPQCVNDAARVDFSVTPFNVNPETQPLALIWWTPAAYEQRDPSIPSSDVEALLANGASRVELIAYPSGWVSGDPIAGESLWPGTVLNADGVGIGWPGYEQQANGTWVLSTTAPFYDLRTDAVVEFRINPTEAVTVAYPSSGASCLPPVTPPPVTPPVTPPVNPPVDPPGVTPPGTTTSHVSGRLATTGFDGGLLIPLGGGLALLGMLCLAATRRGMRHSSSD